MGVREGGREGVSTDGGFECPPYRPATLSRDAQAEEAHVF